jgi:putative oxidoreductase
MENLLKFLAGEGKHYGLLAARAGIGLCFFYIHGLPKIIAGPALWARLGGAMGNLGIHFAPAFWGFMSAAAECFGGLFVALGLLTRPAAAFLAFNLFVATTMHLTLHQGLAAASHAIEDMFFFLGLMLLGSGRFGLDQKLFKGRF